MNEPSQEHLKGFYVTATALLVAFAATLGSQLPQGLSPQWLRDEAGSYRLLWPQAWNFFDYAPSDETLVSYAVNADGSTAVVTMAHMSGRNEWGFGRSANAQLVEIDAILRVAPDGYWTSCDGKSSDSCLAAVLAQQMLSVRNDARHPSLCGPTIFAVERPVPWADRKDQESPRTIERAVPIDLTCGLDGDAREWTG